MNEKENIKKQEILRNAGEDQNFCPVCNGFVPVDRDSEHQECRCSSNDLREFFGI